MNFLILKSIVISTFVQLKEMKSTQGQRPLTINFAQFADDNDLDFKRELIDLIIENLDEIEQCYYESSRTNDQTFLSKAYHKANTTLVMLDDKELNEVIEDLKDPNVGPASISHYKRIKAEIATSLLAERP